ncbi:MAG: GtrA family protein, partial [Ignavibacteriaceae bacterium]
IIAKVAQMRLRIYEMGISYHGRTYEEGKKISFKDGLRTLYCIFRFNAHKAPMPIQLIIYFFLGGFAALINLILFLIFYSAEININISIIAAFIIAALVNYFLATKLLFKHKAKWKSTTEMFIYIFVIVAVGLFDLFVTKSLLNSGWQPAVSKIIASLLGFVLNFSGRRFLVFPESPSGPWKPQIKSE